MKQGRLRQMPMPLALNMVSAGVIGAIHCMLKGSCEPDFPEMTAAAVLPALGMAGKTADALATNHGVVGSTPASLTPLVPSRRLGLLRGATLAVSELRRR